MTRNIRKLISTVTVSLFAASLACLVILALSSIVAPASVAAQAPCSGNPVTYDPNNPNPCIGTGGVDSTGTLTCVKTKTCVPDSATTSKSTGIAFIDNYANPLINIMAGVFGIFDAIVIVVGGIQYSTSADDPSAVSAARGRITNAVIAMLAFLFLYTFLQWITPGGFLH